MAYIRFDNSILSIKGRIGGDIWKGSPQGQQIQSAPRVIHRQRTLKQQQQNDWYCALKREEWAKDRIGPETPDPHLPTTLMVYQLETIRLTRQRTLYEPRVVSADCPCPPWAEWDTMVAGLYYLWSQIPGMKSPMVYKMLMKLAAINRSTYGLAYGEAQATAWIALRTCFGSMILANTIGVGVVNVALLLPWFVAYEIDSFFAKKTYTHSFCSGESLVNRLGILYWCRLYARPSKYMFDFIIGPALPDVGYTQRYFPVREQGYGYIYDWGGMLQNEITYYGWYDVYQWFELSCVSRYLAYDIGGGLYRLRMSDLDIWYYNVPVGWIYPGNPYAFIDTIFE